MPPATAPIQERGYGQTRSWWSVADEEQTLELRWPDSLAVYEAMQRGDAQVKSVLRAVMLPVMRTPWRVDPAGARDEVVQLCADNLGLPVLGDSGVGPPPRLRGRFSWHEHLYHALLMLRYGHSYFAQWYRPSRDARRWDLRKLLWLHPRSIMKVNVGRDAGLESVVQFPDEPGRAEVPIPVDWLVAYVNEREGANWLGTSLIRPVYKNWLIKDRLLRVQAQTIERNGMGVPLYKAQEGASDEDLAEGKKMASAWRSGESAGTAIPNGADLVLLGVDGTLPDADTAIRYHDEQIARNVLSHFLNLGTQTGSWALGSTFADFFTLSLQTVAQMVADVATMHVVEDLVDLNFGEDEPAPRVAFQEIGSRRDATADAIKMLVESGVIRTDRDLEEFVRDVYSLPPKGRFTPPGAEPVAPGEPRPPAPAVPAAGAAPVALAPVFRAPGL